jgi:NAD(P)-dependent dehydrogenase (short-subunit alcohol dehydrogenase family)
MANALVIGSEEGLLEGLAQALHAAGHRALITRSLDEATVLLAVERPVVVIVERECAASTEFLRLRLPPGAALVVYRDADADTPPLPSLIQRATLADLVLPWERQRLITLVQRVAERAQAAGRGRDDTPSENRVV